MTPRNDDAADLVDRHEPRPPTDYQVVCSLVSELNSDQLRRVRQRIEDELRLRREPVNGGGG